MKSSVALFLQAVLSPWWSGHAFVVINTNTRAWPAPTTALFSSNNNNYGGPSSFSSSSEGAANTGRGAGGMPSGRSVGGAMVSSPKPTRELMRTQDLVRVQGNTLKTWSFTKSEIDRVQVLMKTNGRPLNANLDLWEGPDNNPTKITIYVEDGEARPFNAIFETPGQQNAVAIYNSARMEYPLDACVVPETLDSVTTSIAGSMDPTDSMMGLVDGLASRVVGRVVQGGAVYTKPFDPVVQSIQVLLRTDGRPMNARVELIQGPNNPKQVMEIYSEDGLERPLFAIFESPGTGNLIRIINTSTMEYPLTACIEPFKSDETVVGEGQGMGGFFLVD